MIHGENVGNIGQILDGYLDDIGAGGFEDVRDSEIPRCRCFREKLFQSGSCCDPSGCVPFAFGFPEGEES